MRLYNLIFIINYISKKYVNLRENTNRKNHNFRRWTFWQHWKRQSQDLRQGRNPTRSIKINFRRKIIGRRKNLKWLQHPKRKHFAFGPQIKGRNVNLRQDLNWKDHHFRRWTIWQHWKRQSQDLRQGRNPTRSTKINFRRKIIRRRKNLKWLQHPKRKHFAFGPQIKGRKLRYVR